METWKEFEANELTHSAAHHLLAIHEVGSQYGGWARVSDIARQLDITRGSVSINLRALKKRGWVKTGEHHLVTLTPKGLKAVQAIVAKRVIVKAFLTKVLGTPETLAEIDACKIEHLISHATGQRLTQFMRFLTSGDAAATQALARFRRFEQECPETRTCEVCQGHCLAHELGHAI
jgi:DtxR family transcriptional regulator, Mn-dependent transcriptional regulator